MSTMSEVIDKIGRTKEQREQCLEILNLWAAADKVGYEPCDIQVFTFNDQFLSDEEKRSFSAFRGGDRLKKSDYHNCVRLNSGKLAPIALTKKPRNL